MVCHSVTRLYQSLYWAGALWFGSHWRDRYRRWKPYEGLLCEVEGTCWSYGQAPSNHMIRFKGELVFSLDLISFFLAGTSTGGYIGRFPYLYFHRYCRKKNPLTGVCHHHPGFDRGDDYGRCSQGIFMGRSFLWLICMLDVLRRGVLGRVAV